MEFKKREQENGRMKEQKTPEANHMFAFYVHKLKSASVN